MSYDHEVLIGRIPERHFSLRRKIGLVASVVLMAGGLAFLEMSAVKVSEEKEGIVDSYKGHKKSLDYLGMAVAAELSGILGFYGFARKKRIS